jgi:hypothetical protein
MKLITMYLMPCEAEKLKSLLRLKKTVEKIKKQSFLKLKDYQDLLPDFGHERMFCHMTNNEVFVDGLELLMDHYKDMNRHIQHKRTIFKIDFSIPGNREELTIYF